jgi:hypothetical protein
MDEELVEIAIRLSTSSARTSCRLHHAEGHACLQGVGAEPWQIPNSIEAKSSTPEVISAALARMGVNVGI